VGEIQDFGTIVLVVAAGFLLAVLASRLTERFPLPAPALFLVAAAVASDVHPELADALGGTKTVERIAVVALVIILFDGGMHVGWERFRGSVVPIATLGVIGTFGTAAIIALFAHAVLGFSWITAGIVGAALAPTDPAVLFSVLGKREIGGRSGTILEGESGANDPVGIALMIGVLELATHDASGWAIASEFVIEMVVGLAVGLVGAVLLTRLMRVSLPGEGLYAIRVLAAGGVIYGATSVLGGSGFLAVFVAGLLISDVRAPYKGEIERFHTALASLAEIAVFVALGLTVDVTDLVLDRQWLDGLLLALFLALVARPVIVGLLPPARAPRRKRAALRRVGRAQGRRADPARDIRAPLRRGRRRADLQHRLRRRRLLGHRAGHQHSARRADPAGSDAPRRARAVGRLRARAERASRSSPLRRRARRPGRRMRNPRAPVR